MRFCYGLTRNRGVMRARLISVAMVAVAFRRGAGGGGGGYGALAYAAVLVACAGVLGAVDVVALPVQAVRRHHQQTAIERIDSACPIADPAPQVAERLAGEMVQEFHFSSPAAVKPADAVMLAAANPADAVMLEVRTAGFTRSSRIRWEGEVEFRAPDAEILWRDACAAEAPVREVDTFERECEAARAEVGALVDQCVRSVTHRLREAWPREP